MCAKVFKKKNGPSFNGDLHMYYIHRHCEKWKALNELTVKRLCVGSGFCEWVLTSGREFKQGLRLKWNYLSTVR